MTSIAYPNIVTDLTEYDLKLVTELGAAIDSLYANGLPQDLTTLARELGMSLGDDEDEPAPVTHLTKRLFQHPTLRGHHKNLWKRMVNMITREQRDNAKTKLKGYGWNL
jgi:hypothetical protein